MNKQQRYLSLLLLATVYSGAKGMELDTPNQEDAPDKFAILKPSFDAKRKEQLKGVIDWVSEEDGLDTILPAYSAALELEVDANPDKRTITQIAQRKELWNKVKAQSADRPTALQSVCYLSGSEEEQEVDQASPYNSVVQRITRRNKHLQAQAAQAQTITAQKAQLTTEENKRAIQLGKVVAARRALENQIVEMNKQEAEIRGVQGINLATQAELERSLEKNKLATELAQKDKDKLFATLDQKIEVKTTRKQELQADIASDRKALVAETDAVIKTNIGASLAAKEHELTDVQKALTGLKIARAQADGTYSKIGWLAGRYN